MLSCHTEPDLQQMTTKFSNSAKNYGLQISVTKTEVMYQPAPGKPYMDHNRKLAATCHEAVQVSRQCVQMDEDIQARISKASSAYSRLQEEFGSPTVYD